MELCLPAVLLSVVNKRGLHESESNFTICLRSQSTIAVSTTFTQKNGLHPLRPILCNWNHLRVNWKSTQAFKFFLPLHVFEWFNIVFCPQDCNFWLLLCTVFLLSSYDMLYLSPRSLFIATNLLSSTYLSRGHKYFNANHLFPLYKKSTPLQYVYMAVHIICARSIGCWEGICDVVECRKSGPILVEQFDRTAFRSDYCRIRTKHIHVYVYSQSLYWNASTTASPHINASEWKKIAKYYWKHCRSLSRGQKAKQRHNRIAAI